MMPNFDFKCQNCNRTFELLLPKSKKLIECIYCKNKAERLFTLTNMNLEFKGTGFYETDYKRAKNGKN